MIVVAAAAAAAAVASWAGGDCCECFASRARQAGPAGLGGAHRRIAVMRDDDR